LRGKGKRKALGFRKCDIQDLRFQSPCGEKVSGKEFLFVHERVLVSFQSPCGEKVSGKTAL